MAWLSRLLIRKDSFLSSEAKQKPEFMTTALEATNRSTETTAKRKESDREMKNVEHKEFFPQGSRPRLFRIATGSLRKRERKSTKVVLASIPATGHFNPLLVAAGILDRKSVV